jgi:hypothetical protein
LFQNEKDVASLDPWLLKEMDACISDIFLNQDADAFIQLFNLILSENVSGKLGFVCIFNYVLQFILISTLHYQKYVDTGLLNISFQNRWHFAAITASTLLGRLSTRGWNIAVELNSIQQ